MCKLKVGLVLAFSSIVWHFPRMWQRRPRATGFTATSDPGGYGTNQTKSRQN